MVVPVCFFIVPWSYALCVNFVPAYREPADKTQEASAGIKKDEETGNAETMREKNSLDVVSIDEAEKPAGTAL
jgi:FHS family L-fucose permease-like MFS transporter